MKYFKYVCLVWYYWYLMLFGTWCIQLHIEIFESKSVFFLEIMTLCVPGSIYAVLHIVQFPTPANTLGTNYYIRSGSEMSNLLVFHRFLVCSVEFCTNSKCQMDSIWEIVKSDCFLKASNKTYWVSRFFFFTRSGFQKFWNFRTKSFGEQKIPKKSFCASL